MSCDPFLLRFDHDSQTLSRLVQDKDPQVRIKVAELAKQQPHRPRVAARAVCELLKDDEEDVRREAYKALEGLANLYDPTLRDLLDYVAMVLRSKQSPAILDAVKWIEQNGDNSQQDVVYYKLTKLATLADHSDPSVRQAVHDTLDRLAAQVNHGHGAK